MFKCRNCGCEFSEPATITERVGEAWGRPAYQELNACPECHDWDVDDMYQCEFCGEWTVNADEMCDDCRGLVKQRVQEMTNKVANEMDVTYYKAFMLIEDMMEELDAGV